MLQHSLQCITTDSHSSGKTTVEAECSGRARIRSLDLSIKIQHNEFHLISPAPFFYFFYFFFWAAVLLWLCSCYPPPLRMRRSQSLIIMLLSTIKLFLIQGIYESWSAESFSSCCPVKGKCGQCLTCLFDPGCISLLLGSENCHTYIYPYHRYKAACIDHLNTHPLIVVSVFYHCLL